jgi:uncharacterized Zn-binding protein involved in type VI secretion
MAGEIIRKGDPTDHGGRVLEGSLTDICHDKAIAYVGHKVYCPLCKGVYPILEGVLTTTFYGKGVAIAGMKTSCGATLVATQFTDTVEIGSKSTGVAAVRPKRSPGIVVVAVKPFTTAEARGIKPPGEAESIGQEKKILAVFWSFGTDETPVIGPSRFYVDLNLHVKTQNYDAGDLVEISLQDDDGADVFEGVKNVTLRATVDAAGEATLMNVFVGKTVITVPEYA